MKALIKVGLCILISGLLGYIAYLKNAAEFNSFATETLLEIMGTIFAINIGIVPFLHYELNKLEKDLKQKGFFNDVKKEIKQNVSIMTFIIIVSILISATMKFLNGCICDYIFSSTVVASLFITIIMLFDTVSGILQLEDLDNLRRIYRKGKREIPSYSTRV